MVQFVTIRLFLSFLLTILSVSVFCQQLSHSLTGTVTDRNGAVIPNAVIALYKDGEEVTRNTSNADGLYKISGIEPGTYLLKVSAKYFPSTSERSITVGVKTPMESTLDLVLGVGCEGITASKGLTFTKETGDLVFRALSDATGNAEHIIQMEKADGILIVSTRNIDPEWLKGFKKASLKLMTESQIQRKADRSGDFPYTSFPELKASAQCVAIEVTSTWAVGRRSRMLYMSGGGITYEFRKINGKWVMKVIGGWIS